MSMKRISLLLATACLIACNNEKKAEEVLAAPGTVIAKAELPAEGDPLNHFKFGIVVKADSEVAKGVYDVDVNWGPSIAQSKFTMPKGGENLKPILRQGAKPNTFLIGFKAGKDTAFNEYFEVSGSTQGIKMIYTKAYSFE